jgi:gentisate 1,2-dioxygenase
MVWVQEIPAGSRSGKQKHQGGRVHYVLEGKGYTVVDGVRHEWEKGDVVLLPIKPDGVVFQHFNADTNNRVRLVAAEPNWTDALGVDLGASFEQLEDSPDYKPE